jgi:uncharacterized protein (DUF488 family)
VPDREEPIDIWTIGHSTRTLADFLELLRENGIRQLVDIRRFPASRRHPHFGAKSLAPSLDEAGILYFHAPGLGGHRKPRPDSPNLFWRVEAFRGYADHMATDEFRAALDDLVGRARAAATTVMCAEAVPWRCHRQLVSDALVARGHAVHHIIGSGETTSHALQAQAVRAADGGITYPKP